MTAITKTTILNSLSRAMALRSERDKARSKYDTGYGTFTDCLNTALRTSAGQDAILDALWELSDDMSASGGNPYHKLRSTLGNRTRVKYGVHQVKEDGEVIGFELRKKTKGKAKGKAVDSEKAFDQLVASLEKRKPEYLAALAKLDGAKLLKAVKDAIRNAKRA